MKNIRCGQREQSPGRKTLLESDSMCSPLWDQGQMVAAGKRAEQKHMRGVEREKQLLSTGAVLSTPGLTYFSTWKHFTYLGHQAYFALLSFFSFHSLHLPQHFFPISSHSPTFFDLSLPLYAVIFLFHLPPSELCFSCLPFSHCQMAFPKAYTNLYLCQHL